MRRKALPLFEIARLLVHLDHVAREPVEWDEEKKCYFVPAWREAAAKFQAGVAAGIIV